MRHIGCLERTICWKPAPWVLGPESWLFTRAPGQLGPSQGPSGSLLQLHEGSLWVAGSCLRKQSFSSNTKPTAAGGVSPGLPSPAGCVIGTRVCICTRTPPSTLPRLAVPTHSSLQTARLRLPFTLFPLFSASFPHTCPISCANHRGITGSQGPQSSAGGRI